MKTYSHLLEPVIMPNGVVLKNRLLSSNALPHFLQGPETWMNDPIFVYQARVARNAAVVTIGDWSNPNQHKGRQGDSVHFPSFDLTDPSVENSIALYCDVLHMQGAKALMSLMVAAPAGYDVSDSQGGGGMPFPMMEAGDPNDEDTPPPPAFPFGPPPSSSQSPLASVSGDAENSDRSLARPLPTEPASLGFGGGPEKDDKKDKDKDAPMDDMFAMMMGPKKAITKPQLEQLIADAVKKSKRWQDLGFDGISIHMAYQGPLCAKFLSPATNHRTDEFGGPIENRARFPLELCAAIKAACGDKFLVEVLMSGREKDGITVEDTVAFAQLAEGKVDILQLRGGDGDESHPTTFNSTETPLTLSIAEAVKQSGAKLLVAPIGGFEDADLAEQWLSEGKMDLMAAGRAFVCEPDYVKKLHEGRGEDIVPCIRCNKCHGTSMSGPWISVCSVNPMMGLDHIKERLFPMPDKAKKVAVIGGGPAGMYIACLLTDRGHKVTLFEAGDRLGGQLIHADYAGFKWTIKKFKDWQIAQCEKKGVEIRLNAAPTPEAVKAEGFDTVIAAMGGKPNIPDIPGLKNADGSLGDNVFTPISVFGDLDKLGKNVAVIGGSEIGCETGMYVAESGRNVTVFTRQSQLAPSAHRVHYALPALGYHGLRQKLCCTTTEVKDGTLHYTNYKGQEKALPFDSFIVSGGVHPRTEEALRYYGCAPEFYIAGDCAGDGEGSIQKALRSAYGIAMQV